MIAGYLLAALPGIALIILGAPQIIPGFRADYALSQLSNLATQEAPAQDRYNRVAAAMQPRAGVDGHFGATLALLMLQESFLLEPGERQRFRSEILIPTAKSAIRLVPLEPRAWAALAVADVAEGRGSDAAKALYVSYLSSNVAAAVALVRIWAVVGAWQNVDDGTRQRAAVEFRWLWGEKSSRQDLAAIVSLPQSDPLVQLAFTGNAEAARWVNAVRAQPHSAN